MKQKIYLAFKANKISQFKKKVEVFEVFKVPVLAIMFRAPLLVFWFSRERGVYCY